MTTEKCRVCGAPLDRSSGDSLCPACMLRDVLATAGGEAQARAKVASQPLLPRRFGSYELLREIGRGGMGVVYAARQPALNRTVAVKLLLSGAHASETALRRFHTEAKSAAGLQHPNIVEIHDYGEVDGQPFYTMDLVEGQNLGELSAGHPLPTERAAVILRELAGAVHYAHQRGVLHRDLKPSNVLIDREGRPRVTDFGLARRLHEANGVTQTGEVLGSPSYAAPEQAAGRAQDIGVATDVYGLGALGYHLLTGRAPFNAATPSGTLHLVLEADPPPPRLLNPALPRDLETICLKCLAKEPARRYATAAEVAEDIDRVLGNRPIRARPPNVFYRARRFARRYRTGVIAVAAVIVALTAGLTSALVGYRRANEQQRAANAARARSQKLVNFILEDLQPQLQALGRRQAMIASAQTAVNYFEQLPQELRDRATLRAHATSLDFLARAYMGDWARRWTNKNPELSRQTTEKAAALWHQLADTDPKDADAMAAALFDEELSLGHPRDADLRFEADVQRLLDRYRKLEARFPKHRRTQQSIIRLLCHQALNLGARGAPAQALASGREACERAESLLRENPHDPGLRRDLAGAWWALAQAHSHNGNRESALRCLDSSLTIINRLLTEDPTNLQSLALAATSAMAAMWTEPAENRSLERIGDARKHLGTLMALDPADPEWRYQDAMALGMKVVALDNDRRLLEALQASDEVLKRWETLPPISYDRRYFCTAVGFVGATAARRGDHTRALAMAKRLRGEFMVWAEKGNSAHVRCLRRFISLYGQCEIANRMRDWSQLEHLARDLLTEAERGSIDSPGATLIPSPYRSGAQALLGQALIKQGRATEAEPLLRSAVRHFRAGRTMAPFDEFPANGRWKAAENLARALQATGDRPRIVELLEWSFNQRDAHVRKGGLIESRVQLAQTAWLLAQALDPQDPSQAARRRHVLVRARELLDDPETAPRLEPAERDLRTQIGAALAENT